MDDHDHRPIFILGIMPRSGTNYLSDLLCLHPDCGSPQPIYEDFLLHGGRHLRAYVEAVTAHWDSQWGYADSDKAAILSSLGDGLVRLLRDRCTVPRVVTKTPYVNQLDAFFTLFPKADLLIIIRDGRAILESGVRSFKWYPDAARHRWNKAARSIAAFDAKHKGGSHRYRIIRYEDLYADLAGTMRGVLEFLRLDADRYDFDAAAHLGVRGSSTLAQQPAGAVHWNPVERGEDFDPTKRFAHWSRRQHERFNWVAGEGLRVLGYEPRLFDGPQLPWTLINILQDLSWLAVKSAYEVKMLGKERR